MLARATLGQVEIESRRACRAFATVSVLKMIEEALVRVKQRRAVAKASVLETIEVALKRLKQRQDWIRVSLAQSFVCCTMALAVMQAQQKQFESASLIDRAMKRYIRNRRVCLTLDRRRLEREHEIVNTARKRACSSVLKPMPQHWEFRSAVTDQPIFQPGAAIIIACQTNGAAAQRIALDASGTVLCPDLPTGSYLVTSDVPGYALWCEVYAKVGNGSILIKFTLVILLEILIIQIIKF